MSRRIRLRAWDGTKYHGPFTANDIASEMTSLSESSCFSDDLEFELWTGLKDKNGVEIYEGDIVRYPRDTPSINKHYDTSVVEYSIDAYDACGDMRCGFFVGGDYATDETTEIIGNIHENPELLTE